MAITKRLASPIFMPVERKTAKFVVTSRNGFDKIPLAVIVRDILGYAKNYKEASRIIKGGHILVDGIIHKDPKYGAGIMDIITIDHMSFRVVPSKKGIVLAEIPENEANVKLLRVNSKSAMPGAKIQINLHDGTNMLYDNKISTKDVLVVKLPERKIERVLNYKEGNLALVTEGKNAGVIGVIKEIHKINGMQPNKVFLELSGEVVEFPEDYIFVVGEDSPLVTTSKSE